MTSKVQFKKCGKPLWNDLSTQSCEKTSYVAIYHPLNRILSKDTWPLGFSIGHYRSSIPSYHPLKNIFKICMKKLFESIEFVKIENNYYWRGKQEKRSSNSLSGSRGDLLKI